MYSVSINEPHNDNRSFSKMMSSSVENVDGSPEDGGSSSSGSNNDAKQQQQQARQQSAAEYSQERNKKIRKRKEEWKKVLNEGKANKENQPPASMTSMNRARRTSKFIMCDDEGDEDDFRVKSRKLTTHQSNNNIETKSHRDLKARRLRGDVVHAAKRSLKEVDEEDNVEELRMARETKRLEDELAMLVAAREEATKKSRLNKAWALELEMASPPVVVRPPTPPPVVVPVVEQQPKFVEEDMTPLPVAAPAPKKKRRKKSKARKPQTSSEAETTSWLDHLVAGMLTATCCSGQEVDIGLPVVDPPQ